MVFPYPVSLTDTQHSDLSPPRIPRPVRHKVVSVLHTMVHLPGSFDFLVFNGVCAFAQGEMSLCYPQRVSRGFGKRPQNQRLGLGCAVYLVMFECCWLCRFHKSFSINVLKAFSAVAGTTPFPSSRNSSVLLSQETHNSA